MFSGSKVLITGACGTVGSGLLRNFIESEDLDLIGIDNNESALFELNLQYKDYGNTKFLLGDIRDRGMLREVMKGVDFVFHTAAYKHVSMCEDAPGEAISTNVGGTQGVIEAARDAKVGRVLFTSSDKAVNPTNVMGASKLLAERLMTAAAANAGSDDPTFSSTRFGNVLGSRGSVVPLFAKQIANGGPITLTDEMMSRFVMTTKETAELVKSSILGARGGEVFVLRMSAIMIKQLAEVMRDLMAPEYGYSPDDIEIVKIGPKAGEKIYEELTSTEEVRRTLEADGSLIVLPALLKPEHPKFTDLRNRFPMSDGTYRSDTQDALTYNELRDYIIRNRIIEEALSERA